MTKDEKDEQLDELYFRLHNLESTSNKKGNNARYLIDRDRLRREIRDLQQTMTDEDWQMFIQERSEIDVRKING